MDSAVSPASRLLALAPLAAMLALPGLPSIGHAADAHRAVDARPGDIVLLRNVSTRPAARPAPPGMALMVSPSPQPEVADALGSGELSDEDIAQLGAAPSPAAQMQSTVGRPLDVMLVRGSGGTTAAGNGVSNTIATPMGTVGGATRGIGDQVQGALAQLPFGNGH
ncbi:MAG TPA: hypothetical protein VFH59_04465 [Frateuria sp.]|uniref:hypothetical protein n=1 Tax=Frateuria sp. TaxID=2211372 RepID=UPI002D8095AA|nr:hypothetical protein [Frateuria sp.]HET6804679.1 hypothetical protein [Frateuria sp.]